MSAGAYGLIAFLVLIGAVYLRGVRSVNRRNGGTFQDWDDWVEDEIHGVTTKAADAWHSWRDPSYYEEEEQ